MGNSSAAYVFDDSNHSPLSKDDAMEVLNEACHKVRKNLSKFNNRFPSAATINNNYRIKDNDDWTNGFWTGMQAISYEYTQDRIFLHSMDNNIASFKQRLNDHFVLDHHDIGFLYSLSVVAYWDITKQHELTSTILGAADKLVDRFHQDAGFIQAWGKLDNPQEYRLIIDSLINLPLLYKAHEISQNSKYQYVANTHFSQLIENIFRQDYSSHHTFYFDQVTKKPLYGKTFQGFSDKSCWARGQAWAILGLPLNWKLNNLSVNKQLYQNITDYFLKHLPEDGVPYWDLSFTKQDQQPRDTSALAIAICGLFEANKLFSDNNYAELAITLLKKLIQFNHQDESENKNTDGILRHGVYAFSENKGVDECNLWGDYFYMEALYRFINHNWRGYW